MVKKKSRPTQKEPSLLHDTNANNPTLELQAYEQKTYKTKPCLLFLTGSEIGRIEVINLQQKSFHIGRSKTNDLSLNAPEISRHHATLQKTANQDVLIHDHKSRNGTYVNKQKIDKRILNNGDRLQLGPHLLFKYTILASAEIEYYHYLHIYSSEDPATGAMSCQQFFRRVQDELVYARENIQYLTLAIFDIDHFQEANKKLGYKMGDKLLKDMVKRVRNQIRKEDTLARIGGEEFALLFRGINPTNSFTTTKRIHKAIAERPFKLNDTHFPAKVSFGFTVIRVSPSSSTTLSSLFRQAQIALHQAKTNGRNCVRKWE